MARTVKPAFTDKMTRTESGSKYPGRNAKVRSALEPPPTAKRSKGSRRDGGR